MQTEQIKQRLSQIDQSIDQANQACRFAGNAPATLQECLMSLDRESEQAMQMAQRSGSDGEIRDCVDRLEELGDQAVQACREAGDISPQLSNSVQQAHDAISNLKHQLH